MAAPVVDPHTLYVDLRVKRRAPDLEGARAFELSVEFEAAPGATVLFGPSGAGKSTVLACIAGIERPDAGRIALGADVWLDREERIETPIHARGAALVFQSLALFPHMNVLDNVAYGMPKDAPRPVRHDRARDLLSRMRVSHVAKRDVRTLSGGEAQRVALARAFAMTPRALLLDEPFSALDLELKAALLDDLRREIEARPLPTLLVTHDADEARAIGDRVLFIEDGKIRRTERASRAEFNPASAPRA